METLGRNPFPGLTKPTAAGKPGDDPNRYCPEAERQAPAMAAEAEADCIVTGCSMCQANLDTRQGEIKKEGGGRYEIPVLYFTELMGLALGHKDIKKWLGRHITDPVKVLSKRGLI